MAGLVRARIEFADLLRGIAAAAVLVSHLAYTFWLKPGIVATLIIVPDLERTVARARGLSVPDFGVPGFWGYFGVGLFFLVSGFVVPFSSAGLSRGRFVIARLFRIWPTYMAGFTIALACLATNASISSAPFPYHASEILKHYLIVPRWPTLTRPIDGIIWTLEVEIFFYALCVVVMRRLRGFDVALFAFGLLGIPAAVLASMGGTALPARSFPLYALVHWASSMLLFVGFILIGTAFYFRYCRRIGRPLLMGIQGLLFLAFTISWRLGLFGDQGWSGPIAFMVAYVVFAAAYAGRGTIAALPRWLLYPLQRLADISYPLYVVHGVLGYSILAHAIAGGVPSGVALLLALAVVLALSVLLHRVVELPSQAYGKALAGRPVLAPTVVPAA